MIYGPYDQPADDTPAFKNMPVPKAIIKAPSKKTKETASPGRSATTSKRRRTASVTPSPKKKGKTSKK